MKILSIVILLLIVVSGVIVLPAEYINHNIEAEIYPDQKRINVIDKITLPASFDKESIHILLHGDLNLNPASENTDTKHLRSYKSSINLLAPV